MAQASKPGKASREPAAVGEQDAAEETASGGTTASADTTAAGDGTGSGADRGKRAESEVQRRMREVLEAKLAKSKATQGEDHLGGRGLGPSTNDKKTRQFRRKSGG